MSKTATTFVVVVIILAVGLIAWAFVHNSSSQMPAAAPVGTIVGATTTVTFPASGSSAAPAPQSFTVNANDESADLTTITVPKGTPLTITFNVSASGTYHGGLDFESPNVDSGVVPPGTSKTITFTATDSFSFIPYWPASNVRKPYTISIVVQ